MVLAVFNELKYVQRSLHVPRVTWLFMRSSLGISDSIQLDQSFCIGLNFVL